MGNKIGKSGIRNIAEVPWQQFPDHFGGALSKALVGPVAVSYTHLTLPTKA